LILPETWSEFVKVCCTSFFVAHCILTVLLVSLSRKIAAKKLNMHRVDVVETEDGTIVEELQEIMHGDKLIFRSKGPDGINLSELSSSARTPESSRQGEQTDRSGDGDGQNKRKSATSTGQAKARQEVRGESKGRSSNGSVGNGSNSGGVSVVGVGNGGNGGNGGANSCSGSVAGDSRNGSERGRRKGERDRKGRGQTRDGCPQQQQDSQVDSGIEEMRKASKKHSVFLLTTEVSDVMFLRTK
jgi:hypothetical protein